MPDDGWSDSLLTHPSHLQTSPEQANRQRTSQCAPTTAALDISSIVSPVSNMRVQLYCPCKGHSGHEARHISTIGNHATQLIANVFAVCSQSTQGFSSAQRHSLALPSLKPQAQKDKPLPPCPKLHTLARTLLHTTFMLCCLYVVRWHHPQASSWPHSPLTLQPT